MVFEFLLHELDELAQPQVGDIVRVKPHPAEAMEASVLVNNVRNEGPELLEPAA